MADSFRLDLSDALILLGLWSLPTEGAARSVKEGGLPEAPFTPISMRRFEGLFPSLLERKKNLLLRTRMCGNNSL
jgi:hypothetical protein